MSGGGPDSIRVLGSGLTGDLCKENKIQKTKISASEKLVRI